MTKSLASLAALRTGRTEWQPMRLSAGEEALQQLIEGGRIAFVYDEILGQLAELFETREPSRPLSRAELAERIHAHVGATPIEYYGTWVYYPWSRRLVHVLPEAEFWELRTSRNRNKITDAEQQVLRELKLGIAGLSVGQATAVTLALEGVGGEFRLADFDTLALSNMNRVRAGVHSIGVNKTVITAREIYEINPYASVRLFNDGIQDANVDEFLGGLSMLFEECDDLKMKVRLRELARSRKIPVLMETSDRGLFDVERFDKEPDRPLFHGLTGQLDAESLSGMTTYEKVPIVLRIIGAETMSRRMAASLVDIESTLKTWPQLASAVALGGAINTDAARRIALGRFRESGRFFVDLEGIISNGMGAPTDSPAPEPVNPLPIEGSQAPAIHRASGASADVMRALLAHATMAPSGGNCQPWRFEYRKERLRCIHDVERSRTMLDFGHAATYLAFGMLVTNMELVARQMGLAIGIDVFPDASDPALVCEVGFARGSAPPQDEAALVAQRVTNRRLGPRVALSQDHARTLEMAATENGARLYLLRSNEHLEAIANVLGAGERVRLLSEVMHHEMMNEIRWTPHDVAIRRDGLDLATLELTPTDLAGLRLISDPRIMDVLRETGAGRGLERPTRKAVASASAVGLVTVEGTSPQSYIRGGRAVQAVWLAATGCRLAFQPMTALIYMFARLERGNAEGFSPRECAELSVVRSNYRQLFQVPEDHAELMLFRLALAGAPSARSLRRNVADIFKCE